MSWRVGQIALLVALLASPGPAASQISSTNEAIGALPWTFGAGIRSVPGADATYWQSADQAWLGGPDAIQALTLSQGTNLWPTAVGLAVDVTDGVVVIIEDSDIGYVDRSNLENLRSDHLFNILKTLTEGTNRERRRNGHPTVDVIGYEIEPRHDARLDASYWAIRVRLSDGTESVNATAVRLTRDGYATVTWVGTAGQFAGRDTIERTLAPFNLDEGAHHADFREGDPVADVDLEALVTLLAGGVPSSVATAVSLMKYAGLVLLLPLIFAAWRLYRREA